MQINKQKNKLITNKTTNYNSKVISKQNKKICTKHKNQKTNRAKHKIK